MTVVPTVRARIMSVLFSRLLAMLDDDGNPLWASVVRGDPSVHPSSLVPVVGIDEGNEYKVDMMYPYVDKDLTVELGFKFNRVYDMDNYDSFNYYLGKLQAMLFGNDDVVRLDGLANNVVEVQNVPDIDGPSSANPAGVLIITVSYRHINGDPYKTPAEGC